MTIDELRDWLRSWVMRATGLPADQVSDDAPMESFGLSSRDVVILSGELENLLGVRLDATIAYEYPTIGQLSRRLIDGPAASPEAPRVPAGVRLDAADAGTHDIAIVGMAGRFAGAEDIAAIWTLLAEGRTAATEQPPLGRWSEYSGDEIIAAKMASQNLAGAYLDDIASFDPEFFGLSPVEATNMDPQQRLALELAWRALEHAGLPANELRGTDVGVFLGSSNNDYGMLITADPAEAHPYALTGTSSAIIPNRVSYAFDFRGPSINVDTACSSSLVAVHQAVRALRAGDASVALAGGVNIMSSPFVTTAFGELGVISPSGAIHAFSEDADGFIRGDGGGILVLKRVADALAHGDEILAVIKGSAVNSDGHSNGLTAPNPDAQVDVLARAYADALVNPRDVDLVEAHGTGTILGDPIEATALGAVLGRGRDNRHPLLVGSAKTNFGHTESAAGAAGLIKVVLAMAHDTIPASLHYTGPNPYIDFDTEHLEVVEDAREWPAYSGRKLAGVSGFGFGGTNAHVVVAEFDPADYQQQADAEPAQLPAETVALEVSGLVPSRRRLAASVLADHVASLTDADLPALARATARRNHGRSRAVVEAATVEQAVDRLRKVADGKVTVGITAADAPAATGPVFLYSGFGSQHRKMAKDLMAASPLFARRMAELDEIVDFESGWSMAALIDDDTRTYDTETAQVTITAIQIALTDLLAHLGARPAAVIGMSMGEIAAAYAAGGLSDHDAMLIACHRSRLMGEGENSLPEDQLGAMAVVELTPDQLPEGIEPAVYTAPGMLTVGGPRQAVLELVAQLEADGKFARALNVKGAGHTSAVEPLLGELAAEIAGITPQPLRIPLLSSVDRGRVVGVGETVHDADYFLRCTRHAVWLQDATEAAFAHGYNTIVEISPNPVALMGLMSTAFSVGKPDAQLLYSLKRKEAGVDTLRDLLAKLYVNGAPIDFRPVLGAGPIAALPYTPWRRQPYWTAARPSSGGAATTMPGTRVTLPDGTLAFTCDASHVPSADALLEAAAAAVDPDLVLHASEDHGALPAAGETTTVVQRHLGGLDATVYAIAGDTARKVAAAFFAPQENSRVEVAAAPTTPAPVPEPAPERWDPASGETVEQRLRAIVSESMGYDVDDLPVELPLIDLGLDSLMGMRIKNRVENDFQIPPLQVQMLRDGSVADVIAMVEDLVAGRREEPKAAPSTPPQRNSTVGVAPRDASERMVFGTWSGITGTAPAGVTTPLEAIEVGVAKQIAERLTERSGIEITPEQVQAAETLEPLADAVRAGLETDVEGDIRVLRERPAGSNAPAVFMFHPAGGSSVVYQPLARRLPEDVPVYGVERREGGLAERAAAYLDAIREYADGHRIILGGWSFGGALAMEVAHQLGDSADIALIALLDTVQPAEPIPDTVEEQKARWERYSTFAKKTYGLDFPVPYELLETQGEEALLTMMTEFLATTDASAHGLAAGVLEHQRASFVDNRILNHLDFHRWADVTAPIVLFRAERMHDGAIELEPRYATINPDGGWSEITTNLDIVQLRGDHLAIVDEPEIGKVGAYLTQRIRKEL